jgi:hypothetical protein
VATISDYTVVVICCNSLTEDNVAREFASKFYASLLHSGKSFVEAFKKAVGSLSARDTPHPLYQTTEGQRYNWVASNLYGGKDLYYYFREGSESLVDRIETVHQPQATTIPAQGRSRRHTIDQPEARTLEQPEFLPQQETLADNILGAFPDCPNPEARRVRRERMLREIK